MFASSFENKTDGGVINANVVNHQDSSNSIYESKKQPSGCRDPLFALLFYANFGLIIGLVAKFGTNPFTNDVDDDSITDDNMIGFLYASLASGGISIIFSGLMVMLMLAIPGLLIKAAIIFNVLLFLLALVLAVLSGSLFGIIICGILLAIMICYAKAVWSRIPFATANLVTATTAIKANCGVTLIGYIVVMAAFGWSVLWCAAVLGLQHNIYSCEIVNGEDVCSNPNYLIVFLMALSFFFTQQVLKNTVHVTVSGVVGTWWFAPDSKGCCGASIFGSLIRACTTSFGSICFGSLIVAVLQAIRTLVDVAKANDDIGSVAACCIDCIVGCLESLVEYFNKWAFVYVGLYGYGYLEAGKNVMTLFKDRGWDAIIADDLVGMVLSMLSIVVGIITGAISLLCFKNSDLFDGFESDYKDTWIFILGCIIGIVMCSILMASIDSAVLAVIVLFAEGPAEFETNYPELSCQMREAYAKTYPGYE